LLSRKEIKRRLKAKNSTERIIISPLLDPSLQVQQGGIDLRLGVVFVTTRQNRAAALDPVALSRSRAPLEAYHDTVHIPLGQPFVLHPGEMVLGSTLEYVVLPHDVAGLIVGRSTWGRLGLIVATAIKINSGGKLSITLELSNVSRMPIMLYPGIRICQLVLYLLTNPGLTHTNYNYAIGPEFPKLYEDPELIFLGEAASSPELIIGVTGLTNAGKSRVARKIADRLNYLLKSTSMVLKTEQIKEEGPLPLSPEQNYVYKVSLREKRGDDILVRQTLQSAFKAGFRGLVIDGIDHEAEINILRELPQFRLIAVTAPQEFRWDRHNTSNFSHKLSLEEFKALDQRLRTGLDLDGSTNSHADFLDKCIELANYCISSDENWDQIDDEIERIVRLL
jgi:dCTP deaminase